MRKSRLTVPNPAATTVPMKGMEQESGRSGPHAFGMAAGLIAGMVALSGCISVNAPDKPIVIELNINIKQEVIYRLAADAQNTIEQNADIF